MATTKRTVRIEKISKATGTIISSTTMYTDKADFELKFNPLFSETKVFWVKITEL